MPFILMKISEINSEQTLNFQLYFRGSIKSKLTMSDELEVLYSLSNTKRNLLYKD